MAFHGMLIIPLLYKLFEVPMWEMSSAKDVERHGAHAGTCQETLKSFLQAPHHNTENSTRVSLPLMANAASGMAVDDECKLKFLDLKRKKAHRYVIFKIDEVAQKIVVEKLGGPDDTYDQFTGSLPEKDCRYAVYDYDFVTEDNCQKSKIFFVAWSPDVSRVRTKMLYASSKDRFKRELDITYEVQATDHTEIDIEKLKERSY